jgi:hypothetical protein
MLVGICLPTFRDSRNVGKQTLHDNPEERRPQTQLSLVAYKQSSVREKGPMVHGAVFSLLSNRRGLWFSFLAKLTYILLYPKNRRDLIKPANGTQRRICT